MKTLEELLTDYLKEELQLDENEVPGITEDLMGIIINSAISEGEIIAGTKEYLRDKIVIPSFRTSSG